MISRTININFFFITRQSIITEIEASQTLVNANRELITRFEKKIQTTLNRIWGEEEKPVLED